MPVEVHIVTPEVEVWSGDADLVVAHGTDGDVGIMAGHAPLLIRLAVGPLKVNGSDGTTTMFAIDGGFMHVATHDGVSRIDVLADHAIAASDIDVAAEQARLEAASAAAKDGDEDALRAVRRAESRLALTG